MSLIPDAALDALEAEAEDTLTDTVQLLEPVEIAQPGLKVIKNWVNFGVPQPGLLLPAEAGGPNIRADQPSVAGDWALKLRKGAAVSARHRARVSGVTDEGEAWTRLVAVRKVLFPRREILREALCTDVEANP
jgi:hypothetical protein